jgi:hypothetical protein
MKKMHLKRSLLIGTALNAAAHSSKNKAQVVHLLAVVNTLNVSILNHYQKTSLM